MDLYGNHLAINFSLAETVAKVHSLFSSWSLHDELFSSKMSMSRFKVFRRFQERIRNGFHNPRLIRCWHFVASPLFLVSIVLLASLLIPAHPLPQPLGGSTLGSDAIEISKIPTVFPDFSFHASSVKVSFNTGGYSIRINVFWEGVTPGLFYFSFPFKVRILFLAGNGENITAVKLVQPPTLSSNGVDWFFAVQDVSHGIDLRLEDPDILAHTLWRDTFSLNLGSSFTPEIPHPEVNGSGYSPVFLLLTSDTITIEVCYPLEESLDSGSQPTNLFPGCYAPAREYPGILSQGMSLHGASWTFSHPNVFFWYTIEGTLSTKSFLVSRYPPLLSLDLQQTVLVAASLLLGAHITLFVDKRQKYPTKAVHPFWIVITLVILVWMAVAI